MTTFRTKLEVSCKLPIRTRRRSGFLIIHGRLRNVRSWTYSVRNSRILDHRFTSYRHNGDTPQVSQEHGSSPYAFPRKPELAVLPKPHSVPPFRAQIRRPSYKTMTRLTRDNAEHTGSLILSN